MPPLKLLAALLDYPSEITAQLLGEISQQPAPYSLSEAQAGALRPLVEAYKDAPLTRWKEDYVQWFDYSTPTSLNLFEHVHGSSRERGGAMSDLIELYRSAGLEMTAREMPDHLPVFLEFLSTLPDPEEARRYLADIRPILESLRKNLRKASSPYSAPLSLLLDLAKGARPHRVGASTP